MPATPPQPSVDRAHPPGPWLFALATLLVSLGITFAGWNTVRRSQEHRDLIRLNRFVERTNLNLRNRLGRYEDIVRGAQGLSATSRGALSSGDWRTYVDRLDIPKRHPGIASLAFVRQGPGSPPQAGRGGDGLVIELCEPSLRGREALGMGFGANPALQMAADRARETAGPALSGLFPTSLDGHREEAVALVLPVYSGPAAVPGPNDPNWSFRGWAVAEILLNPLVESITHEEDAGIALEIVDAFAPQGPQWLATSRDWPKEAPLSAVRLLDLGGRGWQLRYAIKPVFYRTQGRYQPLYVLLGGLAISLSLAGAVWSMAGTRLRVLGLARQMNASLFEALQRNRSHLEYTPLAVIETDRDYRIREWNPAAEHIFGYSRGQALGKDPRMLVPPEHQGEVGRRRETLAAAVEGQRVTMENITRTGQRIICDWYNTALRDEAGQFQGAYFLADDITERRRAEGALRQAQKLESLGVLAGGIAHDFNNLLTAILGNTEAALERTRQDPSLQNTLQRIEAATQRGSDLARQLLAYAGKAHFSVKPLDLNSLILEMGNLLSVSISKKVTLHRDLQPELPPVEADSAQFQQVIMNLVINASEAIGDRAGSITLRTRTADYTQAQLSEAFPGQVLDPGLYVRLEVEDDGCGMDAATIGRIFDPFFSTKFTGRGLGLSAMLGIVRGHRAGIRVESVPGQGTTFILLFPASEATIPLYVAAPEDWKPISGTVLVVDDEAMVRDLASTALEAAGFRVLQARDGLEAVGLFQAGQESVDLVLLDMTMPRMGGVEAFRRIRALAPGVRILLTSGYTQSESMEDLADLPPDGFLQKPFRVRELVAKVRDILIHSTRKQIPG